jgi:fatty-acyl-CoA synthase
MAAEPRERGWASLSPVRFLLRSREVFADRVAVRSEGASATYAEFAERVERLAGVLRERGVRAGDRVAAVVENRPGLLELHYAAAGSGAVIVPVNFRLGPAELELIFADCEPALVLADEAHREAVRGELPRGAELLPAAGSDYEQLLASAQPRELSAPADEMALLSINYTSGTTGKPKGVMYSHRGAYLHSLGVVGECRLGNEARYLWTLPMFHCHGWAFVWAVTAVGARHVCLPRPEPERAWELIAEERITHLCGAPTVLISLIAHERAHERPIEVFTGGAAPTPALLERCETVGWNVTHLYGLTETYGPQVICEWRAEWDELPAARRAAIKARQGVATMVSELLRVVDDTMTDVPRDGETLGEVVMRGNNVTLGYYRDEEATRAAFSDGWFHTGDLAVMHPNGYIELRDRAKDIIVSGGENISTIEVEATLTAHPAVQEAAVIGLPDERWGERPYAFVTLRSEAEEDPEALREFVRERIAGFKVPDRIEFRDDFPRTATGKIQKFVLREEARRASSRARRAAPS